MSKNFVLVVDTQYDFMMSDGALYVQDSESLIVPISKFLFNLNPDDTSGVMFTFDTHDADAYPGSEEAKMFPPHCLFGTPGWANMFNIGLVNNYIEKFILHKGVFNMWEEKNLFVRGPDGRGLPFDNGRDEFFEILKETTSEVTVIGVALNFCVAQAVNGLVDRGFKVNVVAGLTRGIDIGNGEADTVASKFFAKEIANGTVCVIDV